MEKKNTLVTSAELARAVRKKGLELGLDSFQKAAVRALEEWAAAAGGSDAPISSTESTLLKGSNNSVIIPRGMEELIRIWTDLLPKQRTLLRTIVACLTSSPLTANDEPEDARPEEKPGSKRRKPPQAS